MISKREDRLSHHSISMIIQESRSRLQQREDALYNKDVLDALHALTSLDASELALIASEVRQMKKPLFFSIKHPVMMAGGFILSFATLSFLTLRLLS